jgi:hypothetical protein
VPGGAISLPIVDEPRSIVPEREALAAATAAAALAAILLWAGPPGTDLAAHAYQRLFFLQHGLLLWNNFWYAGRYSFVTYSLLYYPLAALVGIKVLALASIAVAALGFALVVVRQWGASGRLSSRTFAVVWPAILLSAAYPFTLGAALALLAVYSLQGGRRLWFCACAVLTLAASPVAFAFLAVLLAGTALARRRPLRRLALPLLVLGLGSAAEFLLYRLFPSDGRYAFHLSDLVPAIGFAALVAAVTWRIERARLLACIFAVYAAACLLAFTVPSELGGNIARVRYAAIPIALLAAALAGWRPLRFVVPLVALALVWNGTAVARNFRFSQADPAGTARYWEPAVVFLHRHLSPSFRVEAVDTMSHWPADFLPAANIPIVRGWYRQDDFPANEILYGAFGAKAYRAWLRALGVRYVVLAAAPPDYSARAEAALLRGGHSKLRLVLRTPTVSVFELPAARPIVSGPARATVRLFRPSRLLIRVGAPGRYRVAVRYSPYWLAVPGCVERAPDGMLRLIAARAGTVELDFRMSAERALQTVAGLRPVRCSAAGGLR